MGCRCAIISAVMFTGSYYFGWNLDRSALLKHLATCLEAEKAQVVTVSANSVSFAGGRRSVIRSSHWLEVFDSGELIYDEVHHRVCYRLCALRSLISGTIVIGCGLIFSWWGGLEKFGVIPIMLAVGCLFAVPGILMAALGRFRRFLWNAVGTAPTAN
jgi:hypothetical protein